MSAISLYNPLDEFQTYSVHYVMVACRTTVEAAAFTDTSQNVATLDAITKTPKLGMAIPYGQGSNAFLVMDTRRFSQFSVEKMEYEVLINGLQSGQGHGNLATKISMTVQDQSGIAFLNFLQYIMDEKLQTNFDGLVFMIRVIFVGVKNGVPTTVQDVTVPMMMIKMEVNLDIGKGTYNIEWLPYNNFNVSTNDRWMNIYTTQAMFSGDGTLGSLVQSLENNLNKASTDFYNKAKDIKAQQLGADGKPTRPGRQVIYMITLPEKWGVMKYSGTGVANATEPIWKKDTAITPGQAKDVHAAPLPGTRITSVLETLFRQVDDIALLGGGGAGVGIKSATDVTFYKFFTGISSNDDTITVHVDVVLFKIPNIIIETQEKLKASATVSDYYQKDLSDGTRIPKNYAEFNYNFTGKNKDILHFDMKLQDLNILFQRNLNLGPEAMQQIIDQSAAVSGVANKDGVQKPAVDLTSELISARAYDPILLPKDTKAELENFSLFTQMASPEKLAQQKRNLQDYTRNLSLFYAMCPIHAIMTIRGNPRIMDRFNAGTLLKHENAVTNNGASGNSATNLSIKSDYRAWFENNIIKSNTHTETAANGQTTEVTEFKQEDGSIVVDNVLGTDSYSAVPVFVKVNVKGPNRDFAGDFVSGTDFATEILTNNYYVVFRVTNHFERDNFTQTLELWSQNVFGSGKFDTKAKAKTV